METSSTFYGTPYPADRCKSFYAWIVPDAQFADPRLAAIYDDLDGDRSDLDQYVQLVVENGAHSVLDVGCGTGSFACRLAELGLKVVGVDPAEASLDIARRKPFADAVDWIHGNTSQLPELSVDFAIMTGNVAQVFLTDEEWSETLSHIRSRLRPGGLFVFETRIPSRRGWEEWTPELTLRTANITNLGDVEYSVELLDVSLPFVSFRWTYRFDKDNSVLTSDSTLRFRELHELKDSLEVAGFCVQEVRGAPDRPDREYVVFAQATF